MRAHISLKHIEREREREPCMHVDIKNLKTICFTTNLQGYLPTQANYLKTACKTLHE